MEDYIAQGEEAHLKNHLGEALKLLYEAMKDYNSCVTLYVTLADKNGVSYYRINVNGKDYIGQTYCDENGKFWRKGERP